MKWVLFLIVVGTESDNLKRLGEYESMTSCFHAWEKQNDILTNNGSERKVNNAIICLYQDLTKG